MVVGRLTVLEKAESGMSPCGHKYTRWLCQCECGNQKIVPGLRLRGKSNRTLSCGCYAKERSTETHLLDLTGKKFGRLFVIAKHKEKTPSGSIVWICHCECGNYTYVTRGNLTGGRVRSCGCLADETRHDNILHGYSRTSQKDRLYSIWVSMKARCYTKSNYNYNNYGLRGITVCDEWRESFMAFREWALSHGYKDDLSIDRIDVDGNYEPTNCRWADNITQGNNKRNTTYIEYDGKKLSLHDWSVLSGNSPRLIRDRMSSGWPVKYAIFAPRNSKLSILLANDKEVVDGDEESATSPL